MRRFFVRPEDITEETVTLVGQDAHHIANVLRLKIGDTISVSDGIAKVHIIELSVIRKDQVVGIIKDVKTEDAPAIRLTVFQGLPKGKKMDFIVEKLTEIGVARIVPVEMKRSIAEYDGARGAKKLERWRAIAVEAAKQSKRVTVPEVSEIVSFKQAAAMMLKFDKVIVPWEEQAETAVKIIDVIASVAKQSQEGDHLDEIAASLKDQAPRKDTKNKDGHLDIALVIGPEGGIEQAEVDAMMGKNAVIVTLGKTILRTETAGLVASALILLG